MAKMRLDRLLAGQGTQTRKEVRELIRKGRVTVNGQPEKAADRQVEPLTDVIEVDGVPLRVREHGVTLTDSTRVIPKTIHFCRLGGG